MGRFLSHLCERRRLWPELIDPAQDLREQGARHRHLGQLEDHVASGELERLTREKAELVAALRSPLHEDFVDASTRQVSASARARFEECADFDAKRQFLVDHVERVIYDHYKVMSAGSIPAQSASGETKLPFRIEGEIDEKAVRSRPRTGRPRRWVEGVEKTGSDQRIAAEDINPEREVHGAIARIE